MKAKKLSQAEIEYNSIIEQEAKEELRKDCIPYGLEFSEAIKLYQSMVAFDEYCEADALEFALSATDKFKRATIPLEYRACHLNPWHKDRELAERTLIAKRHEAERKEVEDAMRQMYDFEFNQAI